MFTSRPPSHWRSTRRLTLVLLLVWFMLTFAVIFFARELASMTMFGWPLSFYMAAQGLALGYLLIVAVYTWQIRRIDRRHQVDAVHGSDTGAQ
jgi:putative solute:sodium symporter small subunit